MKGDQVQWGAKLGLMGPIPAFLESRRQEGDEEEEGEEEGEEEEQEEEEQKEEEEEKNRE